MNFIEVYDNALTSEQCKLIIDYMNSLKLIPGAVGMDRKVKPETKDSLDLPMNLNQETEVDCIIIDSLFEQRNKYVKKHPFLDTDLKLWNVRAGYNVDNNQLEVNDEAAQDNGTFIDLLSNGFKLRASGDPNVAETYIYGAWAHNSLKYATAV